MNLLKLTCVSPHCDNTATEGYLRCLAHADRYPTWLTPDVVPLQAAEIEQALRDFWYAEYMAALAYNWRYSGDTDLGVLKIRAAYCAYFGERAARAERLDKSRQEDMIEV